LKNASSKQLIELENSSDRSGSGRLHFINMWFEDDSGNAYSSLSSGKSVNFMLEYNVRGDNILNNVLVALVVHDIYGQILFTLSSHLSGRNFDDVYGNGVFKCHVNQIPLVEGIYFIDLWSSVGGEPADCVQGASQITITESDFYGTGKIPVARKHGSFLLDHQWSCAR
jgi:lipopolysaccharide transport system ATP-binding protein